MKEKYEYGVQNASGQWWTGECWGVEQARADYESLDDLPEIPGLDLEEDDTDPGSPQIGYYEENTDHWVASVHITREWDEED